MNAPQQVVSATSSGNHPVERPPMTPGRTVSDGAEGMTPLQRPYRPPLPRWSNWNIRPPRIPKSKSKPNCPLKAGNSETGQAHLLGPQKIKPWYRRPKATASAIPRIRHKPARRDKSKLQLRNTTLRIMTWNADGFNDPARRITITSYLWRQDVDIAVLTESHLLETYI